MRNTIRSVAAAAAVSSATLTAQAQQAVQWRVQDGGNGHWYRLAISGPITWTDARLVCESLGGHLVTPTSLAEDSFVLSIANRSQHPEAWVDDVGGNAAGPWLGGYQPADASPIQPWAWVTGEPWSWAAWASGEPNGGFGPGLSITAMLGWAGSTSYRGWADAGLNDYPPFPLSTSFVIEWSADCNNDGIVDYGQCHDGSLRDYNLNDTPDCCETGTPCEVGNYPVQWRVEDGGNGHWYEARVISQSGASWTDARSLAQSQGADLVVLNSVAVREWVWARLASSPRLWASIFGPWVGAYQPIGSSEPAGGWLWVNGEPVAQSINWGTGQPDNSDSCSGPENFMNYFTNYRDGPRNLMNDSADHPVIGCTGGTLGPIRSAIFEWSADCNGDGKVDYGQILAGHLADTNGDGVPNVCQCPGDVTRNLAVDGVDLAAVLGAWGTNGQNQFDCDINNDGIVNGLDLSFILGAWGPCQ